MKCKCGGELKRIAVDCYQCEICSIKQKVSFLEPNIIDDVIEALQPKYLRVGRLNG